VYKRKFDSLLVSELGGEVGFFFGLLHYGLLAQLVRAPALQAGGQGFDALMVHGRKTV
jgi:hypothetical protein